MEPPCSGSGAACQARNCLKAPITIEARWTNEDTDQDTYLYVPIQAGSPPSPFIDFTCNAATSNCEGNFYPFACVSQDAQGPGDEVTTVRRLLDGRYEYWIELDGLSPAADLAVTLRRSNGDVVRTWTSPENPSTDTQIGWHVFNINGSTGRVTSIDQVSADTPGNAHIPNTNVCPV